MFSVCLRGVVSMLMLLYQMSLQLEIHLKGKRMTWRHHYIRHCAFALSGVLMLCYMGFLNRVCGDWKSFWILFDGRGFRRGPYCDRCHYSPTNYHWTTLHRKIGGTNNMDHEDLRIEVFVAWLNVPPPHFCFLLIWALHYFATSVPTWDPYPQAQSYYTSKHYLKKKHLNW